jgi:hypothetical protein
MSQGEMMAEAEDFYRPANSQWKSSTLEFDPIRNEMKPMQEKPVIVEQEVEVTKPPVKSRNQRFLEQEERRATRLLPDTNGSLMVALFLATIALLTSFVVSYFTLVSVASWMRLPWEGLDFIVPGFIEVMILFGTYDYIITRSRGNKGFTPMASMILFSLLAVLGNASHTITEWQSDGEVPWFGWIGVIMSAFVPFVVVYISKRLSTLVFVETLTEE